MLAWLEDTWLEDIYHACHQKEKLDKIANMALILFRPFDTSRGARGR